MHVSVQQICGQVGGTLEGNPDAVIRSVAGLKEAGPDDLSFLSNPKYGKLMSTTRAGVVLVSREWQGETSASLIRVDAPDEAFAAATTLFSIPPRTFLPGVHPSAVVAPDAVLEDGVHVGPLVVIESGVCIGANSVIQAGCFVGQGTVVGRDCLLHANVTLREYVQIGDRVILHCGVVIGSDGFGYTVDAKGVRTKVPQVGTVVLGNDVEIGANSTVDRARFGHTRIGDGVKIDNLVQIAHNVVVGEHSVLVAQCGVGGSSVIGKHVILAGQSGVVGHVQVADRTVVMAQSGVTKDTDPGSCLFGMPAGPQKEEARNLASVRRLPVLTKRVAELEAALRKLEQLVNGRSGH